MAQDNQIRLPSGQGGLTRFSEEYNSTLQFSPGTVVVIILVIIILIIILNYFGGRLFG